MDLTYITVMVIRPDQKKYIKEITYEIAANETKCVWSDGKREIYEADLSKKHFVKMGRKLYPIGKLRIEANIPGKYISVSWEKPAFTGVKSKTHFRVQTVTAGAFWDRIAY